MAAEFVSSKRFTCKQTGKHILKHFVHVTVYNKKSGQHFMHPTPRAYKMFLTSVCNQGQIIPLLQTCNAQMIQ